MEPYQDESSHYEVSLTAGQALIAFVLLLFSLAASFAFGIIVGKGRRDERLVVQREPAVVSEANTAGTAPASRIVELGVDEGTRTAAVTDTTATAALEGAPGIVEEETPPASDAATTEPAAAQPAAPAANPSGPWFAQLLSTSDAKSAEALAARLIESGFTTAYVDRFINEQGTVFRVRVRFPSETEARAAEGTLRGFARGEVWITRQQ